MDSERFRKLLASPGPFASVYFDDSHDTHDAEAQLELKWRALKEELDRQGTGSAVIDDIGRAVRGLRPPIGRSGRGVVAGARGVLLNEHLTRPTAETIVRVSELPFVLPIVELGFDYPDYLLVVVDHTGADITTHVNCTLRTETVDGGGYPVHKAAGAETAGYGDPQPRTDEAARKNVRAVADRVGELVDDKSIEMIFVVGEVGSRSDLLSALLDRLRAGDSAAGGCATQRSRRRRSSAGHRSRVRQPTVAGHRRRGRSVHRRDGPAIGAGRRGAGRGVLGPAPGRGGHVDHR